MNRFFRWGILLALLVMVVCGVIAVRIIFVPDEGVAVPSLVGLQADIALARLEAVGLSAQIDQVNSGQPSGAVISQSMDPGQKAARGAKVFIKVSKGGALIQVPDVRGAEFAAAVKQLDAAGFKVGTVLRVSDQIKSPGTVIAQNPAFPAMIPGNRMVDLLVSEGKAGVTEMVLVPDLMGQSEELARQILEQSDLTVGRTIKINTDAVPEGSVSRTNPRAGARVPARQAVTLYIAVEPVSADESRPAVVQVKPNEDVPRNQIGTQPADDSPVGGGSSSLPVPEERTDPVIVPVIPQTGNEPALPKPDSYARKIAKVRYQVPPLSRALSLKIQLSDQAGSRILKEGTVKGGEYLTFDAPYSGSASVEIHLGDEMVWRERYP